MSSGVRVGYGTPVAMISCGECSELREWTNSDVFLSLTVWFNHSFIQKNIEEDILTDIQDISGPHNKLKVYISTTQWTVADRCFVLLFWFPDMTFVVDWA